MPEEERQKRQVAKHVMIAELVTGRYVREEGWEPNHVVTESGERISRANLLGVIISIPGDDPGQMHSIVIDDQSGTIPVRSFGEKDPFSELTVGTVVRVIGRPREYGGERYLMAEIVKKIEDYAWVEARLLELKIRKGSIPAAAAQADSSAPETPVEEEFQETNPEGEDIYKRVCDIVKSRDSGEGTPVDIVLKESGRTDAEQIIKQLLEEGELFEIRPGRLKVLE